MNQKGTGSGILKTVGDWASRNKDLLTTLLVAGGATALLSEFMTPAKEGESEAEANKRKKTNALLTGAGGALAAGGLMYGTRAFGNAGAADNTAPVSQDTVDPINGVLGTAVATGIGAGLGAGGTAATIGGINFLRRGAEAKADAILRELRGSLQGAVLNGKHVYVMNSKGLDNVGHFARSTLENLLKDPKNVKGLSGLKQLENVIGMPALKEFAKVNGVNMKSLPKLPIKNLKGKAGLAALIGGATLGLPTAIHSYVNS